MISRLEYDNGKIKDCDGLDVTKKIFKLVKKHNKYSMHYFTMKYDKNGIEYFSCTLPPEYEGYILNSFRDLTRKN